MRDSITIHRPNIKSIQKRVANASIGNSTLRNQGAKGVVSVARKYLSTIDISAFNVDTEIKFKDVLDKHTNCLKQELPSGAKNWGTARKALSVFLEEAFYNKFLSKAYHLNKIGKFLELPVDKYVYEGLQKYEAEVPGFPNGGLKAIRKQDRKYIDEIQAYACLVARKKNISRIFLDLEFWNRPEQGENGKT